MDLGFVGLGRMGANMVRRLVLDGHGIVAYNRTAEKTREIMKEGAGGAFSLAELVAGLSKPRSVWVMVPAGDATESMIDGLMDLLEAGDTIVDGGNSNFHDSVRRHARVGARGIDFVDVGTSGGVWGLHAGYCLTVGGEPEPVARLEPVFRSLAPEGGYLHAGAPGAGHYVKMIHNGIESALMQAYAEGFEILHASDYKLDLAAVADVWMHGSAVRSWLLDLTVSAFSRDRDFPHLKGSLEDSGDGRWTVQEAMDREVPAQVIAFSLLNRFRSRQDDSYQARVLAAMRNEFRGQAASGTEQQ